MLSSEFTLPDGTRVRTDHSLVALSFGEGIVCLKQMLNVMNALAATTSSISDAEVCTVLFDVFQVMDDRIDISLTCLTVYSP
jgi:hypothetical protein